MNLQHLEVFVSVGKHLSLSRAAKDLRVGQPSVTKQLKALEESVKAKLYFRKGRGIALTERGKDLYLRARPILSQVDSLSETFESPAVASKVESFTVGGGLAASSLLLPSIAARFYKKHPELKIYLKTIRARELKDVILKGEAEVAVVAAPAQSPQLISEPYRLERLMFFARPNDPLTKRRHLKRSDLASIPLVVRGRKDETGATEQILEKIEAHGINLNIAMRCDTADAVKTCVRGGLGVGLLHLDYVKAQIERGDFKRLKISEVDLEGQSYIVYHRERPLSPFAQEFLSLLRQARSENPWRQSNAEARRYLFRR